MDLIKIIEKDDIENFIKVFDIDTWKEPITKIENYSNSTKESLNIPGLKDRKSYDDADVLKYAVHNNADKIFDYLLPLVEVDKHKSNYGFPLLAMAIKNNRYDYANKIVEHKTFNPYARYHINQFRYIDSHPNKEEHINFLFNYLEKFFVWDFDDKNVLYDFTHLICYNEETYTRFEEVYRKKSKNNEVSLLEIYQGQMEILTEEVFSKRYAEFILKKLSIEQISDMIKSVNKNDICFVDLFESENAKNGLSYLLQAPRELENYFYDKKVLFGYLSLESLLLLENHGISLWEKGNDGRNAIDYIIEEKFLEDEKSLYFLNKYPDKIVEQFNNMQVFENIVSYCNKKILEKHLDNNLSHNLRKNSQHKL